MMEIKVFQFFNQCTDLFKRIGSSQRISAWKSKGLSDRSINNLSKSDNSLAP